MNHKLDWNSYNILSVGIPDLSTHCQYRHYYLRDPFKYYVIMFLTFLGPPPQLFDDLQ